VCLFGVETHILIGKTSGGVLMLQGNLIHFVLKSTYNSL